MGLTVKQKMMFGPQWCTNKELLELMLGNRKGRPDDLPETDFLESEVEELEMMGLTKTEAYRLQAMQEYFRRMYERSADCVNITSPHDVFEHLKYRLGKRETEAVCFLYARGKRLIKEEILSSKCRNECCVSIPILVRHAIAYKASNVIVVHNHPSKKMEPSSFDLELTKDIKESLKAIHVELSDHIIITDYEYYSLKEHGNI